MIHIVIGRIPITVGHHDNLRESDCLFVSRKMVLDIRESNTETNRDCISIRCNNTGLTSSPNRLITYQVSISTHLDEQMNCTNLLRNIGIVVESAKNETNHAIQISLNHRAKCCQAAIIDFVVSNPTDVDTVAIRVKVHKTHVLSIINAAVLAPPSRRPSSRRIFRTDP